MTLPFQNSANPSNGNDLYEAFLKEWDEAILNSQSGIDISYVPSDGSLIGELTEAANAGSCDAMTDLACMYAGTFTIRGQKRIALQNQSLCSREESKKWLSAAAHLFTDISLAMDMATVCDRIGFEDPDILDLFKEISFKVQVLPEAEGHSRRSFVQSALNNVSDRNRDDILKTMEQGQGKKLSASAESQVSWDLQTK